MNKRIYFLGLCAYIFLQTHLCIADYIEVCRVMSTDLKSQKALFVKCWSDIFQNYSFGQLGINSLYQEMQDCFDKDELDFNNNTQDRLFFNVIKKGQIVGYISFEIQNGHAVYIKQIAVLPELCTADLFRDMIFIVFDYVQEVACVHWDLRRCAEKYKKISAELGFVEIPQFKDSFKFHLKMQFHKCGTCLCDFDYDQEEEGGQDLTNQDWIDNLPDNEQEEIW